VSGLARDALTRAAVHPPKPRESRDSAMRSGACLDVVRPRSNIVNYSFNKISRDDVLSAIGLQSRRTAAGMVLPAIGLFGVGLVVGAGLGLLFAPKSGAQTREVIGHGVSDMARRVTSRIRRTKDEMLEGEDLDDQELEMAPRAETPRNGAAHRSATTSTTPPKA